MHLSYRSLPKRSMYTCYGNNAFDFNYRHFRPGYQVYCKQKKFTSFLSMSSHITTFCQGELFLNITFCTGELCLYITTFCSGELCHYIKTFCSGELCHYITTFWPGELCLYCTTFCPGELYVSKYITLYKFYLIRCKSQTCFLMHQNRANILWCYHITATRCRTNTDLIGHI